MKHTDYLPCHLDEKSGLWVNDQNVVVTDEALFTSDDKKLKSASSKGYYIAPTEKQAANPKICFTGQVHDPLAREINLGISGNAGLFTTAEDVAILCAARQRRSTPTTTTGDALRASESPASRLCACKS